MRCVLHIGPPKTGSSAIQYFLRRNQRKLSGHGVFVPRTANQGNFELEVLCSDRLSIPSGRYWKIETNDDLQRTRAEILADFGRQFAAARTKHHAVILSGEGLAFNSPAEIAAFKGRIAQYFDDFTVVLFLRRPDLLRNSIHKNLVVRGYSLDEFELQADIETMLNMWAEAFGAEAIRPVIFPDSSVVGTPLLDLFFESAGLPEIHPGDGYQQPGIRNRGWDARSIAIIEMLNEHIPPNRGQRNSRARRVLERILTEGFPDFVPYRIERAEAVQICEQRRDSLERVRARWFPDRVQLFHDDFSMYEAGHRTIGNADFAHIIAKLALIFDR